MSAVLAVGALLWLMLAQEIAARAATGLGSQVLGGAMVPALRGLFVAFLTALGLQLVTWRNGPESLLRSAGLVRRPSAAREWGTGLAVSWAAVIGCVLPLVLFGVLQLTFWVNGRAWIGALLSIIGMALATLTTEVVFRSYALERLSEAFGRVAAVVLLMVVYGAIWGNQGPRTFLVACGMALLFSVGWLRTHAVWLPWGLHLGWNLSLGLLFGLPLLDGNDVSSVVLGQVSRAPSRHFPGIGPSGMLWTVAMLLLGSAVLVAVTRDFAWNYTHPAIVAGGFPMDAAPPPAHAAMQASAPAPSTLVQIVPANGIGADRPGG